MSLLSGKKSEKHFQTGNFTIGCNYWASHAGTAMWSDWRPAVVEKDMRRMAIAGLQVLRVFPLWPIFQPLTLLRGYQGHSQEYRHGEEPLPETEAGQDGLSEEALLRFAWLADCAARHRLKLLVSLITGWMSGRLFVPPALEGRNLITDPEAMMWQVRFARGFVRRFAAHPSIVAWDLGNECNCLAPSTRHESWLWTAVLTQTIRGADSTRPVLSGMHSLAMKKESVWHLHDQAELTDMLTTHPYPLFTPHCDHDPINCMRSCLHATAESCLYADVGGKPCLVEEVGSLSDMFASEPIAADYLRTILFSAWAHDLRGLLWWCAFDQSHLKHAPYDWCAFERELGLFRGHGSPKPIVREMIAFRNFLEKLPFPALPSRQIDAVCILSDVPDHWAVAYSAFILAKQAGLDLRFCDGDRPLPDSSLYLLPSTSGGRVLSRHQWLNLMARVRQGATLYISMDGGLFSGFEEMTGLQVQTRRRRAAPSTLTIGEGSEQWSFQDGGHFSHRFTATRAKVLGREEDGNPAFTCARHGQGRVYLLSSPIERQLAQQPSAFHGEQPVPYWKIYQTLKPHSRISRVISKTVPCVGVTEHPFNRSRRLVVMINYSSDALEMPFKVRPGWRMGRVEHGTRPRMAGQDGLVRLPANDALVFSLHAAL